MLEVFFFILLIKGSRHSISWVKPYVED